MAVSFTDKEKKGIVSALRQAAARRAAAVGFKKTTVDELARDAGISKGAFYKFYASKERLFLDVMEQWHRSLFRQAETTLSRAGEMPPRQRAAAVLKSTWRTMREQPLAGLRQDELPAVLRKLPDSVLDGHYQTEDEFIRALLGRADVKLTVPENTVCAAVKMLLLTLLASPQIGGPYEQAMDELIDGLCAQVIQAE